MARNTSNDASALLEDLQRGKMGVDILDKHADTLRGIASLVNDLEEAGIPIGGAKAKKGRRPGRPAGSTSQKIKGGPPTGEVYSEGGRGRKPCPNCNHFVAARAEDCPHCFYNFAAGKVVNHKDTEGNAVVAPFYKKGKGKAAAASNGKSGKPAQAKSGGKEDLIQKTAMKHLKKASKAGAGGISPKDLLAVVSKELDLPPSEVNPVIKGVLKNSAKKNDKTGGYTLKAA